MDDAPRDSKGMMLVEVYVAHRQLDISGSGHDALNILRNTEREHACSKVCRAEDCPPQTRCNVRGDHFYYYSVSHPKINK